MGWKEGGVIIKVAPPGRARVCWTFLVPIVEGMVENGRKWAKRVVCVYLCEIGGEKLKGGRNCMPARW